METRRMMLIALAGVIVYLLYQAWQTDYAHPATPAASAGAAPAVSASAAPGTEPADNASSRVHVQTDLLQADIALSGGELRRVELSQYPVSKDRPDEKLELLDDHDGRLFILQSGLAGSDKPLTNNQSAYRAAQNDYRLAEGSDTLEVPLEYTDADGYTVRKLFRFKRGSYEIEVQQTLVNHAGHELSASPYVRWLRTPPPPDQNSRFVHSFSGLGLYEQKPGSQGYRFKKLKFGDLDKHPYESKQTGGWIAVLQHYFVAAIIPPAGEPASYSAKPGTALGYVGQYLGGPQTVADGSEHSFAARLYIGPKKQGTLDAVAPGLELTEDYGILTPIAKPLFLFLKFFHSWTGNWGVAIILLTLSVKGAFYKLSEAQYRSMAKMRRFSPRIQELRERHADDREKLNRAMMELYKKEGFNPLAGCWPILVQFPVFIALYWVLIESIELRQAPFALWLNDLSAADPYYVMPVLYGLSMWVQQRLSGQTATMDPMQQKIMNVMPIALTGLFLFFPVGLVLYWFISNVIGIAQQWIITKRLGKDGLGRKS
jgi:YidC/Oxa1 family membrane protein insertase